MGGENAARSHKCTIMSFSSSVAARLLQMLSYVVDKGSAMLLLFASKGLVRYADENLVARRLQHFDDAQMPCSVYRTQGLAVRSPKTNLWFSLVHILFSPVID